MAIKQEHLDNLVSTIGYGVKWSLWPTESGITIEVGREYDFGDEDMKPVYARLALTDDEFEFDDVGASIGEFAKETEKRFDSVLGGRFLK